MTATKIQVTGNEMGQWAQTIYLDKYSWKDDDENPTEAWAETAYKVINNVLGSLGYTNEDYEFKRLVEYITDRKFIPGGRYLANSGRDFHQMDNCFLFRCADSISDENGWADIVSNSIKALSSGGGIGVVYSDVRPNGTVVVEPGIQLQDRFRLLGLLTR